MGRRPEADEAPARGRRQLELFASREPARQASTAGAEATPTERLQARLAPRLGAALGAVVLTRNRSRILSLRPARGGERGPSLRIDESFVDAPDEVLDAVAVWISPQANGAARDRSRAARARRRVRRHFEQSRLEDAPRAPGVRPPCEPQGSASRPSGGPPGDTHDLGELFRRLAAAHFRTTDADGSELPEDLRVDWGRRSPRRARRRRRPRRQTIRLGSFVHELCLIRLHPVLDHPSVPREVVESVLFHEMLHAAMPVTLGADGRRRLHPPEFRRRERTYAGYGAARRWLDDHLDELLVRRGAGRPPRRAE